MKKVAVVGLGYVGLPLSLLAARKDYDVTGFDVDHKKIDALQAGRSYIDDVSDEALAKADLKFTAEAAGIKGADIVVICVPTPVKGQEPDLSIVKAAVKTIAPQLKKHSLVVLESTVNPGVCDEIVIPLLEAGASMKVGEDVYLAHCPERINPGDPKWGVHNINRVVGASSKEGLDLAVEFYSSIIDAEIKPMGSLKEAEAVKIVENSFRDINIAFVNELAMSFAKLGIDVVNVIDGAATKPFAFIPHYPSVGVGGHCIPVDPYYLIEYANGHGFDHEFLRLARKINDGMPEFTAQRLADGLDKAGLTLKGARVAVLGLSYKADVADDRESPSYKLIKILEDNGVEVDTYDPHMKDKSSADNLHSALGGKDAAILATSHKEFTAIDPKTLRVKVFVDGKNAFSAADFNDTDVIYTGIGR